METGSQRTAVSAALEVVLATALIAAWLAWGNIVLYALEQVLSPHPSESFVGVLLAGVYTQVCGFLVLVAAIVLAMAKGNKLHWAMKLLPVAEAGATAAVGLSITFGAILK